MSNKKIKKQHLPKWWCGLPSTPGNDTKPTIWKRLTPCKFQQLSTITSDRILIIQYHTILYVLIEPIWTIYLLFSFLVCNRMAMSFNSWQPLKYLSWTFCHSDTSDATLLVWEESERPMLSLCFPQTFYYINSSQTRWQESRPFSWDHVGLQSAKTRSYEVILRSS